MTRTIWAAALVCAGLSFAAENPPAELAKRTVSLAVTPLSFEPNAGQRAHGATFIARISSYTLQLEPTAARFELSGTKQSSKAVLLEFEHANHASRIYGESPLPGIANYFPASDPKTWTTNIPTYSRVHYSGLYPGIDVAFYGNQKKLEYDFILQPGADPTLISLSLRGTQHVSLNAQGDLVLQIGEREMSFLRPVTYQTSADGKTRQPVEGHYVIHNAIAGAPVRVTFALGAYDHARALVIDPAVSLDYSQYLDSYAGSVAVDSAGNTYVAGPLDTSAGAAYLTKFSPTGTVLYNNIFGSGGNVYIYGLAVDSANKPYVAGYVYQGDILPVSTNAYSRTNTASYSTFLTVFSAAGTAVTYCSYLGGINDSSDSWPSGIALDPSGKVYLSGNTNSSTFPTTSGAYQTTAGSSSSWVAKFDPAQSGVASLLYSTLLGPKGTQLNGIAVDAAGSAYVTGNAPSSYPVTPGAFQYTGYYSAQGGAYVTKLNPAGSALVYSAYLGYGAGYGIAVEGQASPSAYVTGTVSYPDFPTTTGAYQTSYAAAFLAKLSANGATEVYSTFLGGPSSYDGNYITPYSVALPYGCLSSCNAYVGGWTRTPDFPAINAIQSAPSTDSAYTAFVAEIAATGQSALFSSYFSGLKSGVSSDEFTNRGKAPALAVDTAGNISLVGNLDENYNDFPTSIGSTAVTGGFLARIVPAPTAFTLVPSGPVSFGNQPVGVSTSIYGGTATAIVRNLSSTPATLTQPIQVSNSNFQESDNCGTTIPAAGSCTLNLDFTPAAAGARTGAVTITSNASNSPTVISLSGTGTETAFVESSQSSLAFGNTAVGAAATQTITLTNLSDITTALTPYTSTKDFSALNNCPDQLAPKATCNVNVTFSPTQTGLRTDSLTIYSSVGPNAYVTLSGTGTVSGGTTAISLSATSLDFGTQVVASSTNAQRVYFFNNGSAPVTVQSLAASGDFSIYSSNCPASQVNPQASCYADITFSPTAAGLRTGTLSFNDSAAGSPHTVALSGNGLVSTGDVDLYPAASVAFPDTAVGVTSSTTQPIYLFNSGTASVTVDRVLITGDFKITSDGCSARVIQGNLKDGQAQSYYDCSVQVSFTPTAAGARTGTLTFVDSAPGSPHVVTLTGNGGTPSGTIAFNPSAVTFPTQPQGTTSAAQTMYFVNPGNTPVTVTAFSFAGDYSLSYSNCGTPPIVLSPGYANCYLNVQFTPTATGVRTGSVTIASSAGSKTATLTGTGLSATQSIALTPTTLNLGSIVKGAAGAYEYIYVRNTGTETVTFTSTTLSGVDASDFALSGSCPSTLAANSSCYFYARFVPSALGARSATLTIASTASPQTLALTGTGVASPPPVSLSHYVMSFDTQLVGGASPVNSYLYLYNNASTPLTLGNAAVSGNFLITHGDDTCSGQVLAAGGQCYLYVQFAPTVAGYLTGSLTFNNSAGTALAGVPSVALAGYAVTPTYSSYSSPTTTNFTTLQVVGTTSATQLVYLHNTGNSALKVGTVTGTDVGTPGATAEFSIYAANGGSDSCTGQSVAAGGSCYVYVTFTPNTAGARSGSLSFPVTYANNSTATVTAALTGTGVGEKDSAVANPVTVSFVDTAVGTTSTFTYTVLLTNSGNRPFTVNTLTGTNAQVGAVATGEFSAKAANGGTDTCSGATVQPGSNCYLYVTFTPTAVGTRTGTISFPVTFANKSTASTKISLTGIGVAAVKTLQITPGSIQFPAQTQGVVSNYQTISVVNTGNVTIHFGADLIATNSSEFAINYDGCVNVNLAYNQNCIIRVTFKPLATSTGSRTGTLTIADNATGGPHTVALTGAAITPAQDIVVSQTAMAFGNQPAGSASSPQYAYVTNQTDTNLPINNIVLAGANAGDFTQTTNCPTGGYNLNARATCYIGATFTPAASVTGARTATITETDATTGSPRIITLTGTSVVPGPAVSLTPATFNFGTVNVGASSGSQNFSITNVGSTNLIITKVAATNVPEFPVISDGCAGATLTTGQKCVIAAKFTPSLGGARTGTISITDNASGSPHSLALTGTGYGIPATSFTAASLTFASQNIGVASPSQQVTLKNPGTDKLVISGVAITGVHATDYTQTNTCGTGLAPAASCIVTVIFKPTAAATRGASVTVTDNANNAAGSTQNIALTGTGVAVPTATVAPISLTFPNTNTGVTSAALSATLTNSGTGPLTIASVALSGTNLADFALVNNCGATLNAAANCTLSVKFTPSAPGARTAAITITDNANNVAGTHQTITLTGLGVGLPSASVTPSFLGYTDQTIASTSAAQVVTLTNSGAGVLAISAIAITGANAADFAQTHTCAATLAAAASCTFSLTFKPTAAGGRQANLVLTDNAGGIAGSTQTVTLFGVGEAAVAPTAKVSPATITSRPSTPE